MTRPFRLLLPSLVAFSLACGQKETAQPQPPAPAANPARGPQLVAQYGCNVCHIIPGTSGPQGSLGPSLAGVGSRPAISFGVVANTPANLEQFIQSPASLNPRSSMPPLNLAPGDAADIAAYLLTLK